MERCAEEHGNGVNNKNKGSNPFKWALLICIGYQCIEGAHYRSYHKVPKVLDNASFEQFCMDDAELSSHDGDCDYLALMAGRYNRYAGKGDDK